ncbi:MAG: ABC transporter ATP-binding protein [Thermoanaerobaculia bacterium]|nr:ABC transporter ATP-binding protein [Thermoanaerobaculia bacterium]
MTTAAARLEGVTKCYPHFTLEELDWSVPEGQITGFIGANGAGKSTTIRLLMGLLRPDRGRVHLLGLPMPAEQIRAKREVGFASEDLRLYGAATLAWHMAFLRGIYPSWDAAYADKLLTRFDLKADQRIKGLSHGQRVKAALLLILARRPRLLLLDEPTTGLDPVARHEVLGALMEVLLDEERTILFSSHNTLDIEQICDRISFLDRGRLLADADKESFLDRWRRLRLEVPSDGRLPELAGTEYAGSGRLVVATTDRFEPALPAVFEAAGARVTAIEPLTLEEIFLTTVQRHRTGEPS